MAEETFAWFVGVDWGSEKHQVCILDRQGNIIGERHFPHGGAGLAELGDWLLSIAATVSAVAVGIEVPHGPVVDSLIDRGFVVHAINPKQLDRLRDRFSVAGAKDDRRDGYVLADSVRTDRRLFRRLHVADPRLVELRAWSRLAEELTEERIRLGNRVHHELWRYYPQMMKVTDDIAASWFLELWTIAPTPAKARQLRKAKVEQLLKQHRIRRIDAESVIGTLREPAIKVADGVAEAASVHMRSLIARLQVVNRELREAERQLDKICAEIGAAEAASGDGLQRQDVMILKSMPGIGRINLAALLSEGSGPLSRRDYPALRTLCGAAPVTRRSGKSQIVIMRYAAHVRLRNTVYHWARVASQHDPTSKSRYAALRARGHSHGRALRGVADRLLGLACVLLQRQTPFDPQFGHPAT
jgi:transposase